MVNNVMQQVRTSVSGRTANTTTLPNAGQIGINITDGIAYSTNGSNYFALGGNNVTVNVTTTVMVGNTTANVWIDNDSINVCNSTSRTIFTNGYNTQYGAQYALAAGWILP